MAETKNDLKGASPVADEVDQHEMSEAEIDRNLADTFPASDPPSWTLGTDHGVDSEKEPGSESQETD